jgi:hypothetical protein
MQTWTPAEEDAFAQLMEVGRMKRMEAVRLYRRCNENLKRALRIAAASAPTVEEVTRRAAFGESARLRAAKRREATCGLITPAKSQDRRFQTREIALWRSVLSKNALGDSPCRLLVTNLSLIVWP